MDVLDVNVRNIIHPIMLCAPVSRLESLLEYGKYRLEHSALTVRSEVWRRPRSTLCGYIYDVTWCERPGGGGGRADRRGVILALLGLCVAWIVLRGQCACVRELRRCAATGEWQSFESSRSINARSACML